MTLVICLTSKLIVYWVLLNVSYTWTKFNLLPLFFLFLVLNKATIAASSSSYSSKGTRTTVSINEWSLTEYVSALTYNFWWYWLLPIQSFCSFFLCLYILFVNIFCPLYCKRKKCCILFRRQYFGYILEAFLDRYIAFLTIHELLLIGRKT